MFLRSLLLIACAFSLSSFNPGSNASKEPNTYFEAVISYGTVVVEFYLPSCPECRRMAPVYYKVSQELGDKILFLKMDAKLESALASKYHVDFAPTIIVFHNGKEERRHVGMMDAKSLKRFVLGEEYRRGF